MKVNTLRRDTLEKEKFDLTIKLREATTNDTRGLIERRLRQINDDLNEVQQERADSRDAVMPSGVGDKSVGDRRLMSALLLRAAEKRTSLIGSFGPIPDQTGLTDTGPHLVPLTGQRRPPPPSGGVCPC